MRPPVRLRHGKRSSRSYQCLFIAGTPVLFNLPCPVKLCFQVKLAVSVYVCVYVFFCVQYNLAPAGHELVGLQATYW